MLKNTAGSILLLLAIISALECKNTKLREQFSWKMVDIEFPNDTVKQEAITGGSDVQEHNLPLGLEVWKDKLFVTFPRWKDGIAATLTYVKLGGV